MAAAAAAARAMGSGTSTPLLVEPAEMFEQKQCCSRIDFFSLGYFVTTVTLVLLLASLVAVLAWRLGGRRNRGSYNGGSVVLASSWVRRSLDEIDEETSF